MESKNIIKAVEADMVEFKALTDVWADSNDISAAAKSRGYAKKLMKSLKAYVSASIRDAANVPAPVEPIPAPVVEEPVVEEIVLPELEKSGTHLQEALDAGADPDGNPEADKIEEEDQKRPSKKEKPLIKKRTSKPEAENKEEVKDAWFSRKRY